MVITFYFGAPTSFNHYTKSTTEETLQHKCRSRLCPKCSVLGLLKKKSSQLILINLTVEYTLEEFHSCRNSCFILQISHNSSLTGLNSFKHNDFCCCCQICRQMSVTLCVLYLFLCICLGEHSHPAASGRSFSGCSSFPVFRQCPAAGFMVNHIQYITYTLHYTHTGLVHLILLWFSAQWLQQEKKKKIYKGFPNANGFISVKHINTVCSSGSFRLSALTHFIQL